MKLLWGGKVEEPSDVGTEDPSPRSSFASRVTWGNGSLCRARFPPVKGGPASQGCGETEGRQSLLSVCHTQSGGPL